MRIAYVVNSEEAYSTGGISAVISLLSDYCQSSGHILDVFSDRNICERKSSMPEKWFDNLCKLQSLHFSAFPRIPTGMYPYKGFTKQSSCVANFLASLSEKLPDIIIYTDPLHAAMAYGYGVHEFIPSFLYIHRSSLLYDYCSEQSEQDRFLGMRIIRVLEGIEPMVHVPELVSQCKKILGVPSVAIFPTVIDIPGFRNEFSNTEGITYIGGGETRKDPETAAKILRTFKSRNPNVPIKVFSARSNSRFEKLMSDLDMYLDKPRDTILYELKKSRLGLHTSLVEVFSTAICEHILVHPVVLMRKPYTVAFPNCPLADTIEDAVKILEKLYFNQDDWESVYNTNIDWLDSRCSYKVADECLNRAASKQVHLASPRDSTKNSMRDVLENRSLSLTDLYKELGWNSPILGAKTLLGCRDFLTFYHYQEGTYVGLIDGPGVVRKVDLF